MIYYEITYAVPQSRCYTQSEIRGGRPIKYLYMYTSFFRNKKDSPAISLLSLVESVRLIQHCFTLMTNILLLPVRPSLRWY